MFHTTGNIYFLTLPPSVECKYCSHLSDSAIVKVFCHLINTSFTFFTILLSHIRELVSSAGEMEWAGLGL